jgi:3D (Asp-Asp-Asp) domain-containing protein
VYVEERNMTVTAYCPCKKCCGWKRNWFGMPVYSSGRAKGDRKKVGLTASGEKARPGTIAADPSIPFGTQLYVPGYGYGVVQDRGGAIKGDHIDVFFKSHKQALNWGRQNVPVKILHPATRSARSYP